MTQHDTDRPLPPDEETSEEIEILEIVGLNDNGAPLEAPDAEDAEDVEVVFEDDEPDAEQAQRPPQAKDAGDGAPLRERMLRLQADFENFKKRIERERADHFHYATFGLVVRIIPVLDNLERAIAAAGPGAQSDPLVEGVLLIHRQLLAELEREGLRPIRGVGESFDPACHEVVATDTLSPVPLHTVTQVLQKGYFLHDRVLRPAMVRVRVDASEGIAGDGDRKES